MSRAHFLDRLLQTKDKGEQERLLRCASKSEQATLRAIKASLGGSEEYEDYIRELIAFEKTELGQKLVQHFDSSSAAPGCLTLGQLRTFRDEMIMQKDDKRHNARLLRILKRLNKSDIALEVFIHSGIGYAVPVLMEHSTHVIKVACCDLIER